MPDAPHVLALPPVVNHAKELTELPQPLPALVPQATGTTAPNLIAIFATPDVLHV
jgi:hypothetical protein